MKNQTGKVALLLSTALFASASVAETVDFVMELNATNNHGVNQSGSAIQTDDGYGVWLNGASAFDGYLVNNGSILVNGTGWGIYETPHPTVPVTFDLLNSGDIQRIQLEQTTATRVVNTSGGSIQGSALFGSNAVVNNLGGSFKNFSMDNSAIEKQNLISFGYGGIFVNGVFPAYSDQEDGADPILESVYFFADSNVTTDKIQFAEAGTLVNGGTVDNESIIMGDDGLIRNVAMAYLEDKAGSVLDDSFLTDGSALQTSSGVETGLVADVFSGTLNSEWGSSGLTGTNGELLDSIDEKSETQSEPTKLITSKMILGKNSQLQNEMGSYVKIGSLTTDTGVKIINGAEYFFDPQNDATAQYTGVIPHVSIMRVRDANLGSGNTLSLMNSSGYIGETLKMADAGTVDISGSAMQLLKDDGTGLFEMGDNAVLTVNGSKWEAVEKSVVQADDSESSDENDTETILEETLLNAGILADSIKIGNDATVEFGTTGGVIVDDEGNETYTLVQIIAKDISFGDNLNMTVGDVVDVTSEIGKDGFWGLVTADEQISFGDNANVTVNAGVLTAPTIMFKDNGTLDFRGIINGNDLIMGENSTIITTGLINAKTTLGSNSQVYLQGSSGGEFDDSFEWRPNGSLTAGVTKAPGAKNVTIITDSGADASTQSNYYTYLGGGVNVDSIVINSGELRMTDDVRGSIGINTDSQLRIVGTEAFIYDPILKLDGATNTKLIIDMAKERVFYDTLNTINVDHIILLAGGLTLNNRAVAEDVTLGDNTSLRLKGDYIVADIVERNGDSVNTTLMIDGGADRTIHSPGTIHVDRVLVESGIFEVNHDIDSVYRSELSSMPYAYEQGFELSSDTTVNINVADVNINRIVRNQEALQSGESVVNTTLNIDGGHLSVERNIDLDNLNVNKGLFEFLNKDTNNVVNVGNSLTVDGFAHIAGAGVFNIKGGSLDVKKDGRLSVSTHLISDQALDKMEIISSPQSYMKTELISDRSPVATLNMDTDSILDLRADNGRADKINVYGTINIADGTRVIVRNIEADTTYELMRANQLNGNMEAISASFLWTNPVFANQNNALTLHIDGVRTLNEGIAGTKHSKNTERMAAALTELKDSMAANTIDPFLDNVFYAPTAERAIQALDEYSPVGYLNAQQMITRTNRTFARQAIEELNGMRTYKDVENMFRRDMPVDPAYYGRPGYNAYYKEWRRMQAARQRPVRTNKGGMWARPFASNMTQDEKDNMLGYKYSNHGLVAGIDRRVGPFSFGVMGLYATGSVDEKSEIVENNTKTWGAGVYGSVRPYKTRRFYDFYALMTKTKNQAKHHVNSLVETAQADVDISAYSIGADVGYDIPMGMHAIFTPKVGIDYTKVSMSEFEEEGQGRSLVRLKSEDLTSVQMPVEVRAAFNYGNALMRFKPELHARWTHEFGDTQTSGKGLFVKYNQPFDVKGLNVDADTFTLGGSLIWLYAVSELELSYDYDFSSSSKGHTVNASYKYMF